MRLAFTDKSLIEDEDWKDAFKKLPPAKQQELRDEREAERMALVSWLEAGASQESYEKDYYKPEKPPVVVVETRESRAKKRQMSVDGLTQSTHAHLLSFSMLWMLTGVVFAFSSYALWLRLIVAPAVLIAQVADILCWWLARVPDVGPYFALAIMGTGAVVGLGLSIQILCSLFDMYDKKGKMVLAVVCLLGMVGLGTAYMKYAAPELAIEKQEAAAAKK